MTNDEATESQPTPERRSPSESVALTDELLRMVRHELRTPVNHIIGYSEMLLEEAEEQDHEAFIADLWRVHAAGKRLLTLINESLSPEYVAIRGVDLALMRHELRTPLNQIIGYSELLQEEAGDQGNELIIADLQKITLAARNLVTLINDGLTLEKINPLSFEAAPLESASLMVNQIAPPVPVSGTILVVDDNEGNRDMLCRRLERLGYTVIAADGGAAALATLATTPCDLVLLDVMMPEMDGYEVLQRLKSHETLRHIPVIMLSALDDVGSVVRCIEMGAEDHLPKPFDPVLLRARIGACLEKKRMYDRELSYLRQLTREKKRADDLLHVVIPIGIALSAEKDFNRLLEKIVLEARALCNADGGTLYLRTEDDHLKFVILRSQSLNIALGPGSGNEVPYPPLPLYDPSSGSPNHQYVVTHAALTGQSINIADAYHAKGFDFAGTRAFDQQTGYRSISFLTVPLKNDLHQVVGVLQLINAKDPDSGLVIAFDQGLQQLIESLSALAAVVLAAYAREQRLRQQIEELRIEVDEARRARQVAEITESDYFQRLRAKARRIRPDPNPEDPKH